MAGSIRWIVIGSCIVTVVLAAPFVMSLPDSVSVFLQVFGGLVATFVGVFLALVLDQLMRLF